MSRKRIDLSHSKPMKYTQIGPRRVPLDAPEFVIEFADSDEADVFSVALERFIGLTVTVRLPWPGYKMDSMLRVTFNGEFELRR